LGYNNQANTDGYLPTPVEIKLVEVLLNPESYKKSITEKCQMAGISRDSYYRIMKNPEFAEFYNEQIKANIKADIGEVIQATHHFAVRFPGNHQDRKMLAEMAGAYTEKQEIKHLGGMVIDIRLTDDDDPEVGAQELEND